MRAAVVERYGGPDVVRIREVDEPVITERDLLVRVEAATVGSTDAVNRLGRPAFARLYFGLTRPKHAVLGYDFAGRGRARGVGRHRLRAGRTGLRHARAFARCACRTGAHRRRRPGRANSRRSRRGECRRDARWIVHVDPVPARRRPRARRADGARQRCVRHRGVRRGAVREAPRRHRGRGVQHRPRRPRPLARRRPGDRLHARGLHRGARPLRRDLRRRRQALVPRVPTGAHA